MAAKQGVEKRITTIAFDGEDLGLYGSGKYAMAQAWQAARTYAPDIVEIGIAHGESTTTTGTDTNAAYPELYWIGELQYSGPQCKMCKSPDTMDSPSCNNCKDKVYQQYLNDPKCMLEGWKYYLGDKTPMDSTCPPLKYTPTEKPQLDIRNLADAKGTCPLLSIEHAHFSPENSKTSTCVQKTPASGVIDKSGICGTFDGFGNWDWDKFEEFMTLLSNKYGLEDIGVYEYQFTVPSSQDEMSVGISNVQKRKSNTVKIATISIGVILGIVIILAISYSIFRAYRHASK